MIVNMPTFLNSNHREPTQSVCVIDCNVIVNVLDLPPGGLCPKVQPLTLLYTIFHEKGTPFVYLLLTNGTPFTNLVKNFASLLTL